MYVSWHHFILILITCNLLDEFTMSVKLCMLRDLDLTSVMPSFSTLAVDMFSGSVGIKWLWGGSGFPEVSSMLCNVVFQQRWSFAMLLHICSSWRCIWSSAKLVNASAWRWDHNWMRIMPNMLNSCSHDSELAQIDKIQWLLEWSQLCIPKAQSFIHIKWISRYSLLKEIALADNPNEKKS